jgi:ElaA protein
MITWSCKNFAKLTNEELYKILKLRNEVFIVEQNCVYQECDDKDQYSFHLMGFQKDVLVAYTRLLPPGISYKQASIGRVVTSLLIRGSGIGKELMILSIEHVYRLFGENSISISAQLYLKSFYESFGFIKTSDTYLEDGIEHIKMLLP